MKRTLENVVGYRLHGVDGSIGKVYDFFIDDQLWKIRYLVVETGSWLNRRRVLISPASVTMKGNLGQLVVNLTQAQVQSSPDVDTDKPVSRQQEIVMNSHYGWPDYWMPEGVIVPQLVPVPPASAVDGDRHLRSFRELSSYHVTHNGERIAKVQDFVTDDRDWSIGEVIVSWGGWVDPRPVALATTTIAYVSWDSQVIATASTAQDLENLSTFDPSRPANAEEQIVYFDYCGRIVGTDAGVHPASDSPHSLQVT